MENAVILKKGKEKAIRNRHHWIFSGAVESMPSFEDGDILPVKSRDGTLLGRGYFNKRTAITGRMLTFDDTDVMSAVSNNIKDAAALREAFINRDHTTAYRVINGEGDRLPGLIVDNYNGNLVMQVATLGMEKLRKDVLDMLVRILTPKCVYDKSKLPARKEEGLADSEGLLYGEMPEGELKIIENGYQFIVRLGDSQKTGFYLDQREMRKLACGISKGKTVLNCFSYTGGFTVYSLKGGARRVDSVDNSEDAVSLSRENVKLNGFDVKNNKFFVADVFDFLRNTNDLYDFVILDPPAFAKKKTDVIKACRGYKDINRIAMKNIRPNGFLMTFSCSYHVPENLFRQVIFQAAAESGRDARIIQKYRLPVDHPINIYHPETEYLKGFLLYLT